MRNYTPEEMEKAAQEEQKRQAESRSYVQSIRDTIHSPEGSREQKQQQQKKR